MSGFDANDPPQAERIDACVHCGFCLPTCPTYVLWGEEMDSPRGRIYLMKAAAEGRTGVSGAFVQHFDACLGCMACVTACPSGVEYGPLVERTRAQIERNYDRPRSERVFRALLFRVLPYPRVLRALLAPLTILPARVATAAARALAKVGSASGVGVLRGLGGALSLLPRSRTRATNTLPPRTAATGERRLQVGLLSGCVQRVMFADVNHATIRVLAAEGCEVVVPAEQGCCGALSRHAGRLDEARQFARRTIEVFENAGLDLVVVNAAGCGSSMKEYGELFEGDSSWHARARAFSARVRDVTELLSDLGEPRSVRHPLPVTVAYHDACHLAHAQRIRTQPRAVLSAIPGLTLVDVAESEMCCGSAGIYNLVQPEPAAALGERKARHLAGAKPDVIASANPGCTMQIAAACERIGFVRPVVHPIELIDRSIRGERWSG